LESEEHRVLLVMPMPRQCEHSIKNYI